MMSPHEGSLSMHDGLPFSFANRSQRRGPPPTTNEHQPPSVITGDMDASIINGRG